MEIHLSVSEIIENASQLEKRDFDNLINKLHLLRAQRSNPSLSKKETTLLRKINDGFSLDKWKRLSFLDHKMEFDELTDEEAQESITLAEELETYTVQRFIYLKELAAVRNISVEELMKNLEISPQ